MLIKKETDEATLDTIVAAATSKADKIVSKAEKSKDGSAEALRHGKRREVSDGQNDDQGRAEYRHA